VRFFKFCKSSIALEHVYGKWRMKMHVCSATLWERRLCCSILKSSRQNYGCTGVYLKKTLASVKVLILLSQVLTDVCIGCAKFVHIGLSLVGARKFDVSICSIRADL